MKYQIFPIGDHGLNVEFGNEISASINNQVLNLAAFLDENPFSGLIEIVPAYASLACFYDLKTVKKNFPNFPTAFAAVENYIENILENLQNFSQPKSRTIEIPVCFEEIYAPDLGSIAEMHNLSSRTVIDIFLARTYRVYMLGFLPGFSYMGEIDERIATPRLDSPRQTVPQGSVGIAGKQTGIYSLESPGGWQIIGRTNIELFTPFAEQPTFLQAGDLVKFYKATF